MKTGTKSVLFGAHQFLIHPLFLAAAWNKLYGPPLDIRLWAAFFTHDLGYIGKSRMDDEEGEKHPEFGARVMEKLFGKEWGDFCLYHSRFYAKKHGKPFSRLCVADKLAAALEPWWLYLPRVVASGEVWEYLELAGQADNKYAANNAVLRDPKATTYQRLRYWHTQATNYMREWAMQHKDGGADTWTPEAK